MKPPQIFLTGATGFVGGDVLHELVKFHPDWSIACLVRDDAKGKIVAEKYSNVRLVYGGLDAVDNIKHEAKCADIVLHFANSADDMPSALAIQAGLAEKETPGFWIHTSGTGILFYPDVDNGVYGERSDKIWDDVKHIDEIRNIPAHALHRDVDQVVLASGTSTPNIRTAIVCPPYIYGTGRGPDKTKTWAWPMYARVMLERGRGFQVGNGENIWSTVHVQDLSKIYLALTEAAAAGGGMASWNEEGYYFASAADISSGGLVRAITETALKRKLLPTAGLDILSAQETEQIALYGSMVWGTNSRSRASRARAEFGWMPNMPAVDSKEMLYELLEAEVK